MNFELSEDQMALADLAGEILGEKATAETLRAAETSGEWLARDAWRELARAGILAASLPERFGGGGFGILEACLVLEQVGRTLAPVPFLETVVQGAMTIAEFGADQPCARLLESVADGSCILTAALAEDGHVLAPDLPATRVTRTADGHRLTGAKRFVPALGMATRVLVPARSDRGEVGVFLVDPKSAGVRLERVISTTYEALWHLELDGVAVGPDGVVGDPEEGEAIVARLVQRSLAGICAMQAGVSAEALRLTARHVSEREQFGHKLATFQAVAQRAADAYIDASAIALTARQAAWRLASGLPAEDALAIAKFWAAEAGQRVAHAAQHLHGGIGVDVDYPLHRYFRRAKHLELVLGGATPHLALLGARLADHVPV
jgi:3-oxocholest-4-en-26-oyl-CoA dehydrogenase beta subunit